jgi:hypothetical protein
MRYLAPKAKAPKGNGMHELVDEFDGYGKVFLGEREVATVSYAIETYQNTRQPNKRPIAIGRLRVIDGPGDLELAPEWILELSDGLQCRCVQTHLTLSTGVHRFYVRRNQLSARPIVGD